jgi:hypothetical protein
VTNDKKAKPDVAAQPRQSLWKQNCCAPVLYAEFQRETLFRVGLRHTGVYCVGLVDGLVKGAWISQGRLLKSGNDWYVGPAHAA